MKLEWTQAPVKTQWGHGMVVASVAIDKDHTLDLYCERDQIAKVEAMLVQRREEHMTLNEFNDYVERRTMHEAIYDDSEGRRIVVIRMLDLYSLVNDLTKKAKHDMAIPPKADTQRSQGTEVQPEQ